jgi:hypothetical protein
MEPPLTAATQLALFAEAPKRRRKKRVVVPLPSSLVTVRCRCNSGELTYTDPDDGDVLCPFCGKPKKAPK